MTSIRHAFIAAFDEDTALSIEAAAEEHANEYNSSDRGTDLFKWALLICIGYECMSKERYRVYHQIRPEWDALKAWIITHGHLGEHDGDSDGISLIAGVYNEFVGATVQ